MLITIVTS